MVDNKRGQITIFVIIGIIIVIGLIIFFLTIGSNQTRDDEGDNSINSVEKDEIKYCLERLSKDSVYFNFLQGGYYNVPNEGFFYDPIEIPYYYEGKETFLPTISEIESQFVLFVENNIEVCLDGKDVEEGEYKVKVMNESIYFGYDVPIYINTETGTQELEVFEVFVPINVNMYHLAIEDFLSVQEKRKDYFPLGRLTALAYENNFKYEIIEIDENTKVVSILLNPIDERREVAFNFVMNYGE
jgi:hypothetical protein